MDKFRSQRGFTLLEVILSMGILLVLTMAVTQILRASFDMRAGLSNNAAVTHGMANAMDKISRDLKQAFIVSGKDTSKNAVGRRTKTLFRIEPASDGDKLSLTTMSKTPRHAGVAESDITYVTYELREAEDSPGRKHLYRGEAQFIPEDLRDPVPLQILARHVKSIKLKSWTGDKWSTDRFDSSRSDTRDKMPKMVAIEIEFYADQPDAGEQADPAQENNTIWIKSVVYLPMSQESAEIAQPVGTIKWY